MRIPYLLLLVLFWVATPFFYLTHFAFNWQWIWLILYVIFQLAFLPILQELFSTFSFPRGLISLILAGAWVYSSHTHAFSGQGLLMWLVTLITLIGFALSIYCLLFWLEKPFQTTHYQPKWWWGLIYAIVPALVWFVYLLTYSPGKMTYDSFWQWDMAHHIMPYNSWHPILHTWLIQATTWLYDSPVSYSIVQIVLVSAIIGYALYTLQKLGVSLKWLILIDLIYALNPVNGFYAITMWKDIPFAAFILLLTVLFTKVITTKGEWLRKPIHMVALILVAFIAMNLRDNGSAVVLAALVLFITFVKGARKRMVLVTIPVLILYYLFNGPLMNALHVIKNPLNQALAVPSQQIAATYVAHGHFTPELKAYFDQILPEKNWIQDYHPQTADPIKHDPKYNASVINQSFSTYLKQWVQLLALNPKTFVSAYLNQMAPIWQFHAPINDNVNPYFDSAYDLQNYPLGIMINAPTHNWNDPKPALMKAAYDHYVQQTTFASPQLPIMSFTDYQKQVNQTVAHLTTKSKLPKLKPILDRAFRMVDKKGYENYFLKGALPLVFLLIGLVASIRRRGWSGIGFYLPAGFVLITIAMAMPAPDFRYSFSFVFIVPFLLLLGKLEVD